MNHVKHTPGPWSVEYYSDHWDGKCPFAISAKNGEEHLACFDNHVEEDSANAILMSAAPEMLEALEHFLKQGPNAGSSIELLKQVESVVSKARGET